MVIDSIGLYSRILRYPYELNLWKRIGKGIEEFQNYIAWKVDSDRKARFWFDELLEWGTAEQ